jgi:hypothetical protein
LSSASKDTTTQSEKQVNHNNKAANQGDASEEKPVMGLENYSRNEIKRIVKGNISQVLEDSEIDATIKGIGITSVTINSILKKINKSSWLKRIQYPKTLFNFAYYELRIHKIQFFI